MRPCVFWRPSRYVGAAPACLGIGGQSVARLGIVAPHRVDTRIPIIIAIDRVRASREIPEELKSSTTSGRGGTNECDRAKADDPADSVRSWISRTRRGVVSANSSLALWGRAAAIRTGEPHLSVSGGNPFFAEEISIALKSEGLSRCVMVSGARSARSTTFVTSKVSKGSSGSALISWKPDHSTFSRLLR